MNADCMKLSELQESSSSADRLQRIRDRLSGERKMIYSSINASASNIDGDDYVDKNEHLSEFTSRISGFHVNLAEDVEARRKRDETRIQLIKDALNHLDRVLQVETHRMEDQVISFRESLNASVDRASAALNERIHTLNSDFATQAASLDIGVSTLEKNLTAEVKELENSVLLCTSNNKETTEAIKKSLDDERNEREAKYTSSDTSIRADLSRCEQSLVNTCNERESGVDAFKKFADSLDRAFEAGATDMINEVNGKIEALSVKIKQEERDRLATQDDIVKTLTATVDSIQNNLDMLSQYTN